MDPFVPFCYSDSSIIKILVLCSEFRPAAQFKYDAATTKSQSNQPERAGTWPLVRQQLHLEGNAFFDQAPDEEQAAKAESCDSQYQYP